MSDNLTVFGVNYTNVTGIKAKGTGNGTLTYIRPTGTKSISENGTGIDVAQYSSVDVAVSASGEFVITLTLSNGEWVSNKTYAETKAAYDAGYTIVANAVGGDDMLCPTSVAFYTDQFQVRVSWFDFDDTGFLYEDTYQLNASGWTLFDRQSYSYPVTLVEKTLTANGTYNPITTDSADGYSLVTVNVPTPTFTTQAKSATPTESQQTVTPDSGYDGLSQVTVGAISTDYVGSGITRRSSSDLTASGATVTVPSGYYSAQASQTVARGTEGTPTATKGTVSNHSVSVTPSVTNSRGYISAVGEIIGTAVTVSASELVSGSETKTANGTYNVTNLASLVVAIPFVTYYTSTSDPTSSQGFNGDIWLVTE